MKGRWPVLILLASWNNVAAASTVPDCFDAEVSALIVRQIPTVPPDCGPECIVMRWPWFLDLDVRRVHAGSVTTGRLTVLSVQHTDYRDDLGIRRWWLRRNDAGGFNLVQNVGRQRPRCASDARLEAAYIRPAHPRTLDDLRREGAAYFERDAGD